MPKDKARSQIACFNEDSITSITVNKAESLYQLIYFIYLSYKLTYLHRSSSLNVRIYKVSVDWIYIGVVKLFTTAIQVLRYSQW